MERRAIAREQIPAGSDGPLATCSPRQVEALLQGRRSVRRYRTRSVERNVLEAILEAACWAPSAHNRQPWRFCVVTTAKVKARLGAAMGGRWRRDLTADGADPTLIERRVSSSRARITGAAALVMAAMSMAEMESYSDGLRQRAEWVMATQSVALACQNLLLAAHAHGLGACWMCAPLFVPQLVRMTLDLPADWEPQALITLGYPAEEKSKERAPLASRVLWR